MSFPLSIKGPSIDFVGEQIVHGKELLGPNEFHPFRALADFYRVGVRRTGRVYSFQGVSSRKRVAGFYMGNV